MDSDIFSMRPPLSMIISFRAIEGVSEAAEPSATSSILWGASPKKREKSFSISSREGCVCAHTMSKSPIFCAKGKSPPEKLWRIGIEEMSARRTSRAITASIERRPLIFTDNNPEHGFFCRAEQYKPFNRNAGAALPVEKISLS